jgi:copper chaperone CopZ
VETVTNALEALSGVDAASVSLSENNVRVSYDEGKTGLTDITKAVKDAGFEVSKP